jgi:hypothetical protein
MRRTALLAVVVLAACSKADTAATADTGAVAAVEPAAASSLASMAGMWNVNVMPADRDTVLTSYVLNTTDSANWTFTFTGRTDAIPMRVTGTSGDTILTEAGPFDSGVRSGQKVSVKNKSWLQDAKLMMLVDANYAGTPADSIVRLRAEGTRQ